MESSTDLEIVALKQLQEIDLSCCPQSFVAGYALGLRHAIELAEAAQARLALEREELTGGVIGRV
jgi:hypothetical protein